MPEEKNPSPGGSSPQGRFSFAGHLQRYNYAGIIGRVGKVPDSTLAAEIGCPRQRIQELRKRLAIPAHAVSRRSALDRVLGRYTDVDIARAFRMTPQAIGVRRRAKGIARASVRASNDRHRLQAYLDQLTEVS